MNIATDIPKYLYHGSGTKSKTLEPQIIQYGLHPPDVPVLYVTPFKELSLFFAGKAWTDARIQFGRIDGKPYLCELYPNALKDAYDTTGYIYTIDTKDVTIGEEYTARLTTFEIVLTAPVTPISTETIPNVLAAIKKTRVDVYEYDTDSKAYKEAVVKLAKRLDSLTGEDKQKYRNYLQDNNPELYENILALSTSDSKPLTPFKSKNPNRLKVEAKIYTTLSKLDPTEYNTNRYRKLFSTMDDKQFDVFMQHIRNGETTLHIYMPNIKNNLHFDNVFAGLDEVGVELFERVWFYDDNTKSRYLTPEKYMVLQLPVRRAKQLLHKKRSIPDSDKTLDLLTGQVIRPDKSASISQIEAQMMLNSGLQSTVQELVKYRGGDIYAYSEMKQSLIERGSAVIDLNNNSIARSTVVLQVFFKAMHYDVNLM